MVNSSNKISYYNGQKYSSIPQLHDGRKMHGVKRVIVFCLMTTILPTILIIIPLYLRHSVFADVTHPVAESDVVPIEDGLSTVFCEALSLKMNTSFNAFQLRGKPQLSQKRKHIRLKKSMTLPDDTLEYWGFYLLKGALVKLKVCSRYEGSRILVVRGEKNLKTCGLMEHNLKKYGAKMDVEHSRVKVTYETAAEELGLVDKQSIDINSAAEDFTDDKDEVRKRIELGKHRNSKFNFIHGAKQQNSSSSRYNVENKDGGEHVRHQKRHIGKRQEEIKKLKGELDGQERLRRSMNPLDGHITHGGNAFNVSSVLDDASNSVSSFETDLLICYDGKILLTRGFSPSKSCSNVDYLEKSNHMITEHLVASDGYYYYIFYSDNDFVRNDIHAVFDIYKPTYRFANTSSGSECVNQTECKFPIRFMSDETVIVEVPTRDGIEHEEDDITLLTSTCHPRMAVYMVFPILVLLMILACAFL
ncbi:uncharacterized protein LOC108904538 isoform X1 [Anoplophora glabripennis]|uniref:uncharacterized protein LOC108904538 isoform X1 n=2 Tax=Anoplophora glabripennis TaxID=217634 RepID=UPI0008753809|nr:uncharacterized protein LOC108904538 isoform X1 [Anoplophora glabripennis]